MGLTILTFATIRAFRGHFTPEEHHGVEISGIYWHFVDVMWIVVYTTVYILYAQPLGFLGRRWWFGAGGDSVVNTDPESTEPPAASGGRGARLRRAGAAAGQGREMINPLRSEAEAYRFLLLTVGYFAAIAIAALVIGKWAG